MGIFCSCFGWSPWRISPPLEVNSMRYGLCLTLVLLAGTIAAAQDPFPLPTPLVHATRICFGVPGLVSDGYGATADEACADAYVNCRRASGIPGPCGVITVVGSASIASTPACPTMSPVCPTPVCPPPSCCPTACPPKPVCCPSRPRGLGLFGRLRARLCR